MRGLRGQLVLCGVANATWVVVFLCSVMGLVARVYTPELLLFTFWWMLLRSNRTAVALDGVLLRGG